MVVGRWFFVFGSFWPFFRGFWILMLVLGRVNKWSFQGGAGCLMWCRFLLRNFPETPPLCGSKWVKLCKTFSWVFFPHPTGKICANHQIGYLFQQIWVKKNKNTWKHHLEHHKTLDTRMIRNISEKMVDFFPWHFDIFMDPSSNYWIPKCPDTLGVVFYLQVLMLASK